MNALIIGAAGFVGGYLADHLQKICGWSVSVTKMEQESFDMENIMTYDLNILDAEAVKHLLKECQPDYIFHLAAQSSVAVSWKNPDLTIDVNIKGCMHVLEAARELEKKPGILLVGSSEEYGKVSSGNMPVSEQFTVHPGNIYAATKTCQNMLGQIYAEAYHMNVVMVRAFNHIGAKQAPIFVVADFCRQVAEIEAGRRKPVMRVGNLSAKRDFTDVRDIVHAYALLIQKGKPGETYNVGSGKAVSIQEILETILSLTEVSIRVETDTEKLRPIDVPVIEADIKKLQEATGWQKKIALRTTLQETLDYWRCELQKE